MAVGRGTDVSLPGSTMETLESFPVYKRPLKTCQCIAHPGTFKCSLHWLHGTLLPPVQLPRAKNIVLPKK